MRRILAELPETLDATYERILQEIPKSSQVHAHRLLQCLTVAIRPLHVEELAEILAVDFSTPEGIPKLNEALRWEDQEQAVLSACSSLIAVIKDEDKDSLVVQFSHFSVKEFLTSDRLAMSNVGASRYHHIRLGPARATMAQACLGILLRFDSYTDRVTIKSFPLAEYAANHFNDHVEFEDVLLYIRGGVDHLLDADKSHFSAWHWVYQGCPTVHLERPEVTPLHYVAGRGFRGLVDYLLSKRPEDVNVRGDYGTPLHAALDGQHINIAELLVGYCADVEVRDALDRTPLHLAAYHGFLSVTRTLVERNADMDARDNFGNTPLHRTIHEWNMESQNLRDRRLGVMKTLLEHGANPDAKNDNHSSPLHQASYYGSVKGVQLMLGHGANTHARNKNGQTPLHRALVGLEDDNLFLDNCLDTVRCLLEHGADIDSLDDDHATPLHVSSYWGCAKAVRLMLENRANVHLEDNEGRTAFQVASVLGRKKVTQLLSEHLQGQKNM